MKKFVSHAYVNRTVYYIFAEDSALVMYRDGGAANPCSLIRVGAFDSLTACSDYIKEVA